jgi:hypothetical protein
VYIGLVGNPADATNKQKMKSVLYTLFDTFNQKHISDHHTLVNALKARQRHAKKWRKDNGAHTYVTYRIYKSDDSFITRDEMIAAEVAAALY